MVRLSAFTASAFQAGLGLGLGLGSELGVGLGLGLGSELGLGLGLGLGGIGLFGLVRHDEATRVLADGDQG